MTPDCLRLRCNLTAVSDVCEAAPISLFGAANGLNRLPEVRFEFPFNLIGKSRIAFLTGQSWRSSQILVHNWRPRTRLRLLHQS